MVVCSAKEVAGMGKLGRPRSEIGEPKDRRRGALMSAKGSFDVYFRPSETASLAARQVRFSFNIQLG